MHGVFIEARQGKHGPNHGKFGIFRFSLEEWTVPSLVSLEMGYELSLLSLTGKTRNQLLVLDLETREGAIFTPGGSPEADLMKHRIRVCPMFPAFLTWLYQQDLHDLEALPRLIDLPEAACAMQSTRYPGPPEAAPPEPVPVKKPRRRTS